MQLWSMEDRSALHNLWQPFARRLLRNRIIAGGLGVVQCVVVVLLLRCSRSMLTGLCYFVLGIDVAHYDWAGT